MQKKLLTFNKTEMETKNIGQIKQINFKINISILLILIVIGSFLIALFIQMPQHKNELTFIAAILGGKEKKCLTPFISKVFLGGVISYSNKLKSSLLNVPDELLEEKGAVSKEVAKKMAEEIRKITGSDIGLSITGIAGPEGGTKYKPVGLVYMHLNAENYDRGTYQIFPGDRDIIKKRSANFSLNLIREYLLRDEK